MWGLDVRPGDSQVKRNSPTRKELHMSRYLRVLFTLMAIVAIAPILIQDECLAQNKPRARELGIPFEGATGPVNAITDVRGVEVGHTTIISGEGKLVVGKGRSERG